MGIGPSTSTKIIEHLEQIYCDSIGVEYMYIRDPEKVNWIQQRLNVNNNHPSFSVEQKKAHIKKATQSKRFPLKISYTPSM